MKNVIAAAEKHKENQGPLIEKVDKVMMAEVTKVLTAIDIDSKCKWVISNADMNAARDLRLTGVKKYWRYASQI